MKELSAPTLISALRSSLDTRMLQAPRASLLVSAGVSGLVTLLLTIDAMVNPRAFFDLRVMALVQGVDLPYLDLAVRCINAITNSFWSPVLWAVVLCVLLLSRWWLLALTVALLPIGGAINHAIGAYLVDRTRPEADEVSRTIGEWGAPSFPSGHVMGAVMLYGFLLYLAPRLRNDELRMAVRIASITIIMTVGFARLWIGAHWPSDVLAAYSLGGLILVGLIASLEQVEAILDEGRNTHPSAERQGTLNRFSGRE